MYPKQYQLQSFYSAAGQNKYNKKGKKNAFCCTAGNKMSYAFNHIKIPAYHKVECDDVFHRSMLFGFCN